MTLHVGVDGSPDGWFSVAYGDGYRSSGLYGSIEGIWEDYGDEAETILVDVPIGMREESAKTRPCDREARDVLGHPRSSSVFAVPVRDAVYEDSYEDAKRVQEERTEGSIGRQTWNISGKIKELDEFFLEEAPEARGRVRESHPEVCFWALNDGGAMEYSKTQQPAGAFWERVDVLEDADGDVLGRIREAGTGLCAEVSNDDIVDAFALALTASPLTGELRTLGGEKDPNGLPMEMVYAEKV